MDPIIIECMQNQAIINIGMIGNVANGKSTVTRQLTGKVTQQHSSEKINNITIKLGYANAKIWKCDKCPEPQCYRSSPSSSYAETCEVCENEMQLVNHVSIVDCPGHNSFTATMLNGSSIMDNTILVEAVNNLPFPGPQTYEHLNAIKISNIPNLAVCVNKLDLTKKDIASSKIYDLKKKLMDTPAENSDIIPISANFGCNIDVLCSYLAKCQIPEKKLSNSVRMIIIRSFNINKVNTLPHDIQGGVVGGSIVEGMIAVGDKFIIKPGFVTKNPDYDETNGSSKRWLCYPLISTALSINADQNKLTKAISGGLIGICSHIDPSLAVNDRLTGNILTEINNDEDIYEDLLIDFHPLDNSKTINKNDRLLLNYNACNTACNVFKIKTNKLVELNLQDRPICARIGDKLTISKNDSKVEGGITIIGYGIIINGFASNIIY